ncbi:hypothetical protein NPS01_29780 [Nocardioides psychrotolerans]|uniref:DUF3556 domain-containing protein n=1 Tax=Nocardioides psychrotolerans TaxID=1005945 RepID=A0A1I3GJ40_9ACTN|nr:DUF3556 domain-containing protein [Nocardioides psychrotolerans]GEP39315.1 hypothetical protein NPS01_29780 [Nocardioides psychrotolerans]SFI23464.1 Transmembrane protein of unknown function [Nocardioides psychrotolerans]
MGFISPNLPDLDREEWARGSRMERMRPMVQDWAQAGFSAPEAVYVLYTAKIALYCLGAALFTAATPGIGGLGDIADWWSEPIFFQKVVVFTLLFEVLGLGCGFGPLTLRFLPPIGAFLHWLRPGTVRLPPWPSVIPLTRGTHRTLVDVILYAGLLLAVVQLLLAPGVGPGVGVIDPLLFLPLFGLLVLVGLRDKTIFLAARTEVYGTLAVFFLFSSGSGGDTDMIVGLKLMMVLIWWGAATSKLNQHFPHVVSVMMSNNPLLRVRAVKRRFHRDFPDDIRPSRISTNLAHGGTVVEYVVPLVLLLSDGGPVTAVAAIVMVCFHLQILTSLPMGVPLEWNVFMIFGIGFLFVENATVGVGDLGNPLVLVVIAAAASVVVLGNLFPHQFSFLPAMRYYAGNWATSLWCFTPSAVAKLDASVVKGARLPATQLEMLYGEETAALLVHKGYAFRAMHTHGRALFGLIPRACGPDHETDYSPHDGEFVAGVTLGWNFGDGHLHHEQLLAALQERCAWEPGEVRLIALESQRFWDPRQEYRLVDAATGELERGVVHVSDMLERQPWAGEIPVHDVVTAAAPILSPEA